MTPMEATELAMKLFWDNFPKLQQQAIETIEKRIEDLVKEIVNKLEQENVKDLTPFTDPDVQYALYEVQRDYARMGTKEMLDSLTALLVRRVKCDGDYRAEVIIDKAISIAGSLLPEHLDLLAVIFIGLHVKFSCQSCIQLKKTWKLYTDSFQQARIKDTNYLFSLGCLVLNLNNPVDLAVEAYKFKKEDVEAICPPAFKQIPGDYGLSEIGMVLALTHIKVKMDVNLDWSIWIN